MADLVEFPVGDDGDATVTFEVDSEQLPDDLVLAAGDGSSVAGRARETLDAALSELKPALERFAELARGVAPTEASIELGLKIGGQTGVIVAKGTAEANVKVKLTWKDH